MFKIRLALVISLALAIGASGSADAAVRKPARAGSSAFDGMWSVLILTNYGPCDRGYRYPIRISRGVIYNAGDASVAIYGRVSPGGATRVSVNRGDQRAHGSGRLSHNRGYGAWTSPTAGCGGTWSAHRRG
jgi:hypothetical protein